MEHGTLAEQRNTPEQCGGTTEHQQNTPGTTTEHQRNTGETFGTTEPYKTKNNRSGFKEDLNLILIH